jgi:hypothetical protein
MNLTGRNSSGRSKVFFMFVKWEVEWVVDPILNTKEDGLRSDYGLSAVGCV